MALSQWQALLTDETLVAWTKPYTLTSQSSPKTVAIIMAGNIPLVGFHDFLCVLVSGNKVLTKLSSNDKVLLPFIAKFLIAHYPALSSYITFTEGKLTGFDAVIATGSNNTSRYFDYYFSDYPNIIRKKQKLNCCINQQGN